MKSVLPSWYIKAKTSAENRGRVKPIESRAGFVILILHPFAPLGKGCTKAYRQPCQHRFDFDLPLIKYNKRVCKSYEDAKCSVRKLGMAFEAVLAQIFYCRVGYSKSSHIAKITQLAIIFQRCNECFT